MFLDPTQRIAARNHGIVSRRIPLHLAGELTANRKLHAMLRSFFAPADPADVADILRGCARWAANASCRQGLPPKSCAAFLIPLRTAAGKLSRLDPSQCDPTITRGAARIVDDAIERAIGALHAGPIPAVACVAVGGARDTAADMLAPADQTP